MELLDFKIVLPKSLIVRKVVAVEILWSAMCLAEKYFQLVPNYTSQLFKQREQNVDTAILKGLKTKHTFNISDSFLSGLVFARTNFREVKKVTFREY